MLCDECGSNAACVHMIKVLNGVKTEQHLCGTCASSAGEACFSTGIHFSVNDLVKAMFSQELDNASAAEVTCPNCGNDRNFQVKTLQMHVVHLEDGRVEVSDESRPAVLEVLCDECESALNFEEFEDTLRKEVLLTIGAR